MARKRNRQPPTHLHVHRMSVAQFEQMFPNDDACKAYLVAHRWPDGVRCPRCGSTEVKPHGTKPFHWQCSLRAPQTTYRFSVLVDTISENTNKSLRDRFRVVHLMLTSKKGMSALQVFRYIGFGSYKTAWRMCTKIRAALGDDDFGQLVGYVEVDETYVGGKATNKHKGPSGRGDFGGTGGHGKAIVVGAVRPKGNVVARVIANNATATASRFIQQAISHRVNPISTDDHKFSFRYNHRKNPDIFGAAIRRC